MDGINRTRIIDSKTEQPAALALDLVNKLVYWVDLYLDYVEVVDYQGKNRHTVIQGRQVSITLLENATKVIKNTWYHITLRRRPKISMLKIPSEVKLQWVIKITMPFLDGRMFFSQCILCIGYVSHSFLPCIKSKAHRTKQKQHK